MKLRWKIAFAFVALATIPALLLSLAPNQAERELEATRRSLRQQGFKIDLKEFDLSISPEQSARAAMLGTTTRAALTNRAGPGPVFHDVPRLLTAAGTNAALVVWRIEKLKSYRSDDLWPELRETLKTNRARLDAARQAALSGPIRFQPIGSPSPNSLLPYLADLKGLVSTFGLETVLALHDGDKEAAWTNQLASTCLVTAYTPEPIDISHLVRFACAGIAYGTIWNALQAGDWTDAQLAELQRRWESVDFWIGLPETAAYSRANMAGTCQLERQQSLSPGMTLREALESPRYAWSGLRDRWRRVGYRQQGTYEDERDLLLYYRDRELELRRALQCPTWSEMRQLPGVTNLVPFRSKHASSMQAMMNMRQMSLSWQGEGQGLLGRAAEAETGRRIIVTALALERYRGRHGSFPKELQDLVPELMKTPPVDFMDGKPLRYRLTEDHHFVLHSVGLDCVDNGGQMRRTKASEGPFETHAVSWSRSETDLVWPRPASTAEAELLQQEENRAQAELIERQRDSQAQDQWSRTARRQAKVETILSAPSTPVTNEPVWRDRLLREVLHNEKSSGTNKLTLTEMLTLNQVVTGAEPEIATFELPINYDVLMNVCSLRLYIDPIADEDSDEGCNVGQLECHRATNGNCLLLWSTIYESPGKHALQAELVLEKPTRLDKEIIGPMAPFVVSNLCQFSLSSATFDRKSGVTLAVKLPEPNGACTIELNSSTGEHIKTISGTTSNGIIKVHWDLVDERGKACTNDSFDTVVHVTLPESGRSQTLRGP